ncbi:hypothetical protein DL93DRAFT_1065981 [Clavulina sp. PMI_390]|nr:hypothetical protein DL93DRAFT_1065981 [Clavulina sp. PMI_390]
MGPNRSVIANAAQQLGRFHLPPFEALPILMYHKNRRNLARSRVWRLVAESDEMIEAATNLESQVKALLASLTQWKARVANSLAGILSLPTELLQRIFTFVVSGDLLAPNQSITLSHVCSRWRRASVDLPALWVRLRLVPPKGNEALRELSQRARGAAIKLSIDFKHARPLNLERHVGPELVEKIAELSVMSSLGPSSMILPQHPPAKLIAFSETSNNSKPSLITSPSLSHIQRLEMRNVTFPISSVIDPLPFPYLTSISLSSVTSHHLIQFLRSAQAPLLHDLQIESSDYRYPSDPMPPHIVDSLVHLKIVDSPYMLPSLFWAFEFPNLETFHLECRTHQPGMTGVTYDNSVRAVMKEVSALSSRRRGPLFLANTINP